MAKRLRRRQSRDAETRSAVPQHDEVRPKRVDLALAAARHRPSLPGRPAQPDRRLHQPRRGLDPLLQRASVRRAAAGLEIGAWRGWSTAHLIASGLGSLHVVEPLLADPDWRAEFEATVRAAGGEADHGARSGAEPRGGRPPRRSRPPLVVRLHRRRPRRRGARRATRLPACPISSRRRWSCSTISSRPMSPRASARWKRPAGA